MSIGVQSNPKADAALRRATELKQSGKIDEAVEALMEFQSHAAAGSVNYTIESFLRLPLYLQAAGRREEAWERFYKLLKDGYPHQLLDDGVVLYERSIIYDKMRLFLQRDDNDSLAVHFWILAYAARLAALFKQKRFDELGTEQAPEKIKSELAELLEGDDRPDLASELAATMAEFIKRRYDLEFIEAESQRLCG